ncbi:alpha/beta fold hydrolase [Novosphingobium sp. CECT 9465]|uniref:alpha/beta fold hydrolase n=1 Tax=Novosphingobium sp. CECT 9465 TaxID=2829794 RepID=UPI001E3615F5|nr:alpha/beta fold hydrolase [Novosphingobium sp. CECT 9465]CAH0495285.1 Haloalkane dehalogenase [Novosphingobium sp. CECT 9465]
MGVHIAVALPEAVAVLFYLAQFRSAKRENTMHRISKQFVTTSEGDIFVQSCGSGAIPVCILNITSFGTALIPDALPHFADQGCTVHAIDLLGYGRSDKFVRPLAMEQIADVMIEAIRALGLSKTILVSGHYTGLPAIEMASRNDGLVERLVLDGTPFYSAEMRAAQTVPVPADWQEDGSHARTHWEHFLHLLQKLNPGMTVPAQPDHRFRQAYIALLEVFAFSPPTMQPLLDFPIEDKLASLRCPALVLRGGTDWNRTSHEEFTSRIADVREHRFDGVHPMHDIFHPERAKEYVDVLLPFFAEARAVSPAL